MDTVCPYCRQEIWFGDDEWDDMVDDSNEDGCVRGICPECEADCCYTCQHVYASGLTLQVEMPQVRQREQLLQNPNYPF